MEAPKYFMTLNSARGQSHVAPIVRNEAPRARAHVPGCGCHSKPTATAPAEAAPRMSDAELRTEHAKWLRACNEASERGNEDEAKQMWERAELFYAVLDARERGRARDAARNATFGWLQRPRY